MNRRLKKFVVPAVFAAAFVWWSCDDGQDTSVAPQMDDVAPQMAELPAPPSGGGSGAIFTTTPDGGIVNENVHYEFKREVYLDGGPPPNAPAHAAGLDAGFYVFQITDPPGKLLLSVDPARCRIVEVNDQGVISRLVPPTDPDVVDFTGAETNNWADEKSNPYDYSQQPCHQYPDGSGAGTDPVEVPDFYGLGRHDTNPDSDHGSDTGAIVVQMMPFGTTPNPGGVYKAWMTPLSAYLGEKKADLHAIPSDINHKVRPHDCPDFCANADPGFEPSHRYTKTDNFKVEELFTGEIRVRKFHDLDYNGVWDNGEPEIGKDQFVDDETGAISSTPGTDFGGWPFDYTEPGFATQKEYTPFLDVIENAGTYAAEEYYLDGWFQSASWLDGAYDSPFQKKVEVPVTVSGEIHEIWFGNSMPGKITGNKVIDYDADGVIDPGDICPSAAADGTNNPGCEGVTVKLTGEDGMGTPVSLTTTTGAGGYFEFTDLMPGTYAVEIVEPTGFNCSYPSTANCKYEDIVITSGLTVDLNKRVTGAAAFADWTPGSKEGMKFEDITGDGIKDATDPGLAGWKIHLWGTAGTGEPIDMSMLTDEEGSYSFDGVPPGQYNVCEVIQDGAVDYSDWLQTYPKGTAYADYLNCSQFNDGTTYGPRGYAITLTSGMADKGNDFGNFETVTVKICKLKDVDGSSLTTHDREIVKDWTVYLTIDDVPQEPGKKTADEGCATWEGLGPLPAGSYYDAAEKTEDGWVSLGVFVGDDLDTFMPKVTEVDFESPPKSGAEYKATFVNTPTQGCTPGFWGGGSDGGQAGGQWLWNEVDDEQWPASGGKGTNPFIWDVLFNDYVRFDPSVSPALDGLTMHDLVNTGGGAIDAQKAARSLVAAYLNASWGMAYAYSTTELEAMWLDAASSGGFLTLHTILDKANNAPDGCPISASGY